MKQNILPDTGFIRLKDILLIYPIGKSTVWAKVKKGEFPKPIRLGPRTVAWEVQEIREFIESISHKNKLVTGEQ